MDCPTGPHGAAICEQGACGFACDEGFADCDAAVGCETATTDNKQSCGGCGITCAAFCRDSICDDPVLVRAGGEHTCALLKGGSVWCWGANDGGQVGDGTTDARSVPAAVPLPLPALDIACGGAALGHTCAVLADKRVACWGANSVGQLGMGTTSASEPPVVLSLSAVTQIAAGAAHSCAVTSDQQALCWGLNSFGQVGDGSNVTATTPVVVDSSAVLISAGAQHTCAVRADATLACWGHNDLGQLGIGAQPDQSTPAEVFAVQGVVDVAGGGAPHTCALTGLGMYCWGSNSKGQLGLGSMQTENLPQPVALPGASALGLGSSHSGAVVGGELMMWGWNSEGQLGDGTPIDSSTPAAVGLTDVVMVSLGSRHSCALSSAGAVLCWGSNGAGQLGDGTTTSRSTPAPVVWP